MTKCAGGIERGREKARESKARPETDFEPGARDVILINTNPSGEKERETAERVAAKALAHTYIPTCEAGNRKSPPGLVPRSFFYARARHFESRVRAVRAETLLTRAPAARNLFPLPAGRRVRCARMRGCSFDLSATLILHGCARDAWTLIFSGLPGLYGSET